MERLVGSTKDGSDIGRGGDAASVVGTVIEWYDFFIYGAAAALVFTELFFPEFAPLTGTLAAFGTYALGFFARPLGGIVFGNYGDKIGRKAMLVITLMLMGVATTLMGLLPTFEQVGYLAPAPAPLSAHPAGTRRRGGVRRARWSWRPSTRPGEARALREPSLHGGRHRARCSRPASSRYSRRCPRSSSSPGAGGCPSC